MTLTIAAGDVVQINPIADIKPAFAGCFVIVTEVRAWGIIGYVPVPEVDGPEPIYVRLAWAEFERLGKAKWIAGSEEKTRHE